MKKLKWEKILPGLVLACVVIWFARQLSTGQISWPTGQASSKSSLNTASEMMAVGKEHKDITLYKGGGPATLRFTYGITNTVSVRQDVHLVWKMVDINGREWPYNRERLGAKVNYGDPVVDYILVYLPDDPTNPPYVTLEWR